MSQHILKLIYLFIISLSNLFIFKGLHSKRLMKALDVVILASAMFDPLEYSGYGERHADVCTLVRYGKSINIFGKRQTFLIK